MNLSTLSKFVFGAGVYNLLLALGLCLPPVTGWLGLVIADQALALIIAALLVFTAVAQIVGSRNLQTYAWLIFWEGLVRWMAAAILIIYGFAGHLGAMAGVLGIGDFLIGCIFVIVLPKTVRQSHVNLLKGLT